MCIHYWLVDSANKAKCKKCGTVKDFQPAIDKFSGDDKGHRITKAKLLRIRGYRVTTSCPKARLQKRSLLTR